MTAPNRDLHATAIAAYQAARGRPNRPHRHCLTPAHRVRRAYLNSNGAPCHLCGSQRPHRLIATRTPSWDSGAATPGHAALLGATTAASRIARYAAAVASPRVKAVCPGCLPAARIHCHLETLNAACHGPNVTRTPQCSN